MSAQFIEIEGKQAAVVPADEYKALLMKAEMLDDIVAYDAAKAEITSGEDELIPQEVANALLNGDSPVKVWRKHRGLSQAELGEMVGVSQAYIAQIETGRREGAMAIYQAFAEALGVSLDDLI